VGITDTQKRIDRKLDEVMLSVLDGVPLVGPEGKAVLDDDGKPVMVPPSAAMLQAIRARMRDLNVSRVVNRADDPANRIADRLGLPPGRDPIREFHQAHGGTIKFPNPDDEDDDEATRTG